MERRENAVKSLKELLGHGSALDFDRIRALKGAYALYRPFHIAPKEKIMISLLEIGLGGSEFDCRVTASFPDEFGDEQTDVFEGKMVPHETKLLAICTSPGLSKSNFIIHFDNVNHRMDGAGVKSMSGIVLSAAGPNISSAWPTYARKIGNVEEFKPSIIDGSEFKNLSEPIQEALSRGGVHWQQKHFSPPFGSPSP